MTRKRRIVPATELRVHLGEALKGLEDEDIVVEKGGVPVAMLVRYGREAAAMATEATGSYERALSRRAEPGGWQRAVSAMERGWAGISAEELTANIYRWREEGATTRRYGPEMDEAEELGDGGSTIPGRQRYLQQGAPRQTRIADEPAEWDVSGRTGD